jgi:hypothetical protein
VVFVVLGVLLTAAAADLAIQSRHVVGKVEGMAVRSQSLQGYTGTSGHTTTVGVVAYEAGGRTRRLDGPVRKAFDASALGETVDVWYYGRWPGLAWINDRWAGPLVAGSCLALYWALVVAALWKRLRRWVGR